MNTWVSLLSCAGVVAGGDFQSANCLPFCLHMSCYVCALFCLLMCYLLVECIVTITKSLPYADSVVQWNASEDAVCVGHPIKTAEACDCVSCLCIFQESQSFLIRRQTYQLGGGWLFFGSIHEANNVQLFPFLIEQMASTQLIFM